MLIIRNIIIVLALSGPFTAPLMRIVVFVVMFHPFNDFFLAHPVAQDFHHVHDGHVPVPRRLNGIRNPAPALSAHMHQHVAG